MSNLNPGAETYMLVLRRADTSQPWGFRLQGGTDFSTPLSVQLVNPNSIAEQCGLKAGDAILKINDRNSDELEHEQAKYEVLRAGNEVRFLIQRGVVKIWRPKVTPIDDLRTGQLGQPLPEDTYVQRTSLAADKQESLNIGSSHNVTARPFPGFGGGSTAPQQPSSIQPSYAQGQYSAPTHTYAADASAQSYQAQAHAQQIDTAGMASYGMGGGDVYGGQGGAPAARPAGTRSVQAPVAKPPSERKEAQYMTCKACGSLCVGVFVKIKGEPFHPECFKCTSCGKNLKNQGYFTLEDKMYCDMCARQVAKPPGPDMVSVPVYR